MLICLFALACLSGCHGTGGEANQVDDHLLARCSELERRALEDNEAIVTLRSLVTAAPKRLSGSPGRRFALWEMTGTLQTLPI